MSALDGTPQVPATRVVLRPIANPLPLGLLALAGGTLIVSGLQLKWLQPTDGQQVALILLAFVVPLQLVSSVFGVLARDVVAGTGMGVLAGTWLAIALIRLTGEPGSTSDPLGLLLLVSGVALTTTVASAATGKVVVAAVLLTAAARFATTGMYELTAVDGWRHVSGIVGLVLCALGLYAALALVLEDGRRQTVLPLGRRGLAAESMHGTLAEQVQRVHHEAGVREQL
ncbi:MAG: hypothetical protein JWN65_2825 [Solirubrobacterales bacterium]|nr:hypothetical protein [Solirubrobacterales bacterium]